MNEKNFKNVFDYEAFDINNKKQLQFYKTIWLDAETRKYYKHFSDFSTFEEFIKERNDHIYFVKFQNIYIGWVRYLLTNAYRKEFEILYIVSPEYRGYGYGKRIVKDFTNFLKTEHKARLISAIVEKENEKSKNILEQNGFQLQKTFASNYHYYEWRKKS